MLGTHDTLCVCMPCIQVRTNTHMYIFYFQVKAYQEDFEAERRDKEQMRDETDLAHFTSEANCLAQQLKLKTQYEKDWYRKHLESKVEWLPIMFLK